jgi:hypothetical protein
VELTRTAWCVRPGALVVEAGVSLSVNASVRLNTGNRSGVFEQRRDPSTALPSQYVEWGDSDGGSADVKIPDVTARVIPRNWEQRGK